MNLRKKLFIISSYYIEETGITEEELTTFVEEVLPKLKKLEILKMNLRESKFGIFHKKLSLKDDLKGSDFFKKLTKH